MRAVDQFLIMLAAYQTAYNPPPDIVLLSPDFRNRFMAEYQSQMPCAIEVSEGRLSKIGGIRVATTPDIEEDILPLFERTHP